MIKPRQPLLNPELIRPDSRQSTPRPPDRLWLDKNENLDPVLLEFTTGVLRTIDPSHLCTYPEPAALYRKLAAWLDVSSDALVLTPGSDGAIRQTFEVFVHEGDVVAHTLPTFAMYSVYCQIFGARAEPLMYERGTRGPRLDVEKILGHLSKVRPRLFCLPNPDSPTGTVLEPDELRAIVDHCARLDTVMLVDEAYHPFYAESCVAWTRESRHLVVARTFAKAWGLAGLRIGYAVGHPETIRYYHKLRPMYELGAFSIAFMERMFDHLDMMEASVRRINDGKHYFRTEMQALGFETLDTQGNFQHVAFGPRAEAVHHALEKRVLYRKDFREDCLKGYSRFSLTTVEKLAPLVETIRRSTIRERQREA
jgi:histidinol-phosphate aminotransferase